MNRKQRIAAEISRQPIMQIVKRRVRNARRRIAQKPLTGCYYWVPIPAKGGGTEWSILEFYDKDYKEGADHASVWSEVMFFLATKWNKPANVIKKQLLDSLYGLPRGRVSQMADGNYGIAHGKDAPIPNAIQVVKRLFNLKDAKVVVYKDEHEVMMQGHPKRVEQAIGVPLGLKTPKTPKFNEPDYVDTDYLDDVDDSHRF